MSSSEDGAGSLRGERNSELVTVRQHIKAHDLDRVKLSIQHGPLGSFDRADGEKLAALWNEHLSLRRVLEQIEEFGYNNSGKGYSCARMASIALGKEPK